MPTQRWASEFYCIHRLRSLEIISKACCVSHALLQSPTQWGQICFMCFTCTTILLGRACSRACAEYLWVMLSVQSRPQQCHVPHWSDWHSASELILNSEQGSWQPSCPAHADVSWKGIFDIARSMPLLLEQAESKDLEKISLTPPSHWCQLLFICECLRGQNFICIVKAFCRQGRQVCSTLLAFKRSHRNTPLPLQRWY